MFRQRDDMLPTTMGGAGPRNPANSRSLLQRIKQVFVRADRSNDGSAASIYIAPPVVQSWNRSSWYVRRCYQVAIACVILLYTGYRTIRYQNAYIHLTCQSTDCNIRIQPIGWDKAIDVAFAREQFLDVLTVKVAPDGTFITDQNVVTEDYQRTGKNKNKKKTSNYKGPDDDGNFITYAIYLKDKKNSGNSTGEVKEPTAAKDENGALQPVSLAPLLPYLEVTGSTDDQTTYRMVLRKFRIQQSRRRVRTVVQKIVSYIKNRRQTLLIKENSAPSWQGIVMTVVGLIGFLLSILLGQLWEEDDQIEKSKKSYAQKKKQQQMQQQKQKQQAAQQLRLAAVASRTTPQRSASGTTPSAGPGARRPPAQQAYGGFQPQQPHQQQQQLPQQLPQRPPASMPDTFSRTRKRVGVDK